MDIAKGKRVSATEAAEILGVPRYAISRIDRAGEIIKRFKLGHKTHVYDLDSLYAFLEASLVKPIQKPIVTKSTAVRQRVRDWSPEKKPFSLREFLDVKDAPKKKR
ncbi:hypothetical protein [Paraburkholderia sp. RL17-381-BIF-C]|uniref:hypothetical protein n=1 Tax=Paraburkholderia sp. RL17-381-BIF-C TaxID=3031635 RepID=UPI0038BD7142